MDQDPDSIVDEFMGDNLRVQELAQMRDALAERLRSLQAGGATPSGDPRREIASLRRQLAAVEQEMVVSEFVEASVRAALARPPGPMDPDAE